MSSPAAEIRKLPDEALSRRAQSPAESSPQTIDAAVERLREGARRFARLSLDQRIELAQAMQQGYLGVAEASVRAGCAAKGLDFDSPAAAEEWATGPWCVIRHLRLVRESLAALKRTGTTPIRGLDRAADGRLSVGVFPGNAIDGMLFQGCRVDVRMQAGVDEGAVHEQRAAFYRGRGHDGRVVLVLGAGNIACIPSMDVITKMFNEGKVCVLKMNPVNAYLGPYIERAFAAAIDQGFLAVVYGGAEQGAYLTRHAGIDEIHITGSDATHDAIVWGSAGAEGEGRRQRNEPLVDKPMSSELGNVSPVIVVPGPYTERELAHQAEDVAAYLTMNDSFLCNAAKMLITPRNWPQRDVFLAALRRILEGVPVRRAYYPGAEARWEALTKGRYGVMQVGERAPGRLPWTLIPGLDPEERSDPLFTTEAFCPILGECALGSTDPAEFLEAAVNFANERLWGTLSATLIVHPQTLKDPRGAQAVERAIARLRYGTVALNGFPGMSFAFAAPPWGGYPGSTPDDIQSGSGWVHNTAMLEGIEKAVMRFPLTMFPKPGYFPTHRTAHKLMRALIAMDRNARWGRVPAVMLQAMRG